MEIFFNILIIVAPLSIFILGSYAFFDQIVGLSKLTRLKMAKFSEARFRNLIDDSEYLDNELTTENCITAIDSLMQFIRNNRPDILVGVHPGGQIITAYIADKLGYGKDQCAFANTDPARTPDLSISFYRKDNYHSGEKIIFIDDISRSGRTLKLLERLWRLNTLNNMYFYKEALFAAMVEVVSKNGNNINRFKEPDWFYFNTDEKETKLPWSTISEDIKLSYALKTNKSNYDKHAIEFHEKLVSDFDFAKYVSTKIFDSQEKIDFEKVIQSYSVDKVNKDGTRQTAANHVG